MWVIMRRIKGAKDAITYSYYNGDFKASNYSTAFDSDILLAATYDNRNKAQLDRENLARNGLDVSVEDPETLGKWFT